MARVSMATRSEVLVVSSGSGPRRIPPDDAPRGCKTIFADNDDDMTRTVMLDK